MAPEGEPLIMASATNNKKGKLVSHAYETLKRKVITLELKPGEYLDERKLMDELKVGRTPLRESILRLKSEGMVEGEPNKSSHVKDVSLKDTMDLMEAMLIVEKNVTFLAAQRITSSQIDELKAIHKKLKAACEDGNAWEINSLNRDFHRVIAAACANEHLTAIHGNLRNEVLRLSYLVLRYDVRNSRSLADHYQLIVEQHKRMIECLENHTLNGLEELCVEHIRLAWDRMLGYLQDTVYL